MIDLNDVWQPPARFDLPEIRGRLAATAPDWLPGLFPHGLLSPDRRTLRCADLAGRSPRKEGSCIIHLAGHHAGWGFDHATGESAGPIDLIHHATGLADRELFEEAARLARLDMPAVTRPMAAKPTHDLEIARIIGGSVPLAGTIGEIYLKGRGIGDPRSPDLLFHDDLPDFEGRRGWPGLVGIVRDGAGNPVGGIHRTFLLDGGSGKAPPGKKMLGSVAGGSVRLSPIPADGHLGIGEGIETALSAWAIFGIPTWAALSAGNLRDWQWPEGIRRVTIFADAGDAGMQAAAALADRLNAAGIPSTIVSPLHGDDFNDDLGKGAVAAHYNVHPAVEEAPPTFESMMAQVETLSDGDAIALGRLYAQIATGNMEIFQQDKLFAAIKKQANINIPTSRRQVAALRKTLDAAAADHEADDVSFDDEVRQMATAYPLPRAEGVDLRLCRSSRSGEIMVHRNMGSGKDGRTVWQPVASPFGIPSRLRYLDQDDAYGLRMVIRDMHGNPRVVDFPRSAIAQQGAQEIRSALYAAGLRTCADGDQVAVMLLKAVNPQAETLVVSRPGWHRLEGHDHPVFVTPAGQAIGDASALELAANARCESVRGTLDGWKAAVAAAASVQGCPHFLLGVLAGFSGVVQSLAGLDSCGLNLSGLSSSGKTTAQKLAVSAWTSTGIGAGLLQSMRSTENAVEVIAQAASGTVLALDELAHVDGRTIAKLIYAIAGGQGKARMTAGAMLKQRYAWSTYALLSSECSLEEKVRADGGAWIAGMAVRIVDVDVTDVDRTVPASTLRAIAGIDDHHGHAGPAFVEQIIAIGLHQTPDVLRERILAEARNLAGDTTDSARIRAATCLALPLVAGQLAQEFGLLPSFIDIETPARWAWTRFQKSSDAEALTPGDQVISMLRAWIAERWDVTIKAVDAGDYSFDRKANNREAVAWYDRDAIYIPAHRLREAAGETLKAAQISKILTDRDMLARRGDEKRAAIRYIPGIGRIDAYALRRSELGRSGRRIDEDDDL
ncbi:MAG: DUF927 domain-containing protein [Magnetospirillum sp.]|uniref:DNA primase traC n=1 Tax=Paramagnetospirillum magnetotacticum MS-1 TaxID=272627 RepID=A0A0C2YEW3_PARME|nr:DUF927 domain-containing protein [Paramagnetospirillum magnetotacticum]KIL98254.1 hypothetical protein CCC_01315 [Paramagnetospirillum magnetotacticum MS-1]MBI3446258.1 DUF927 domain-containing protein [Magnetospirillum sp.]